jgi:hypothetical protein
MPLVGFEPTIADYERAKTVHVLDRSATVTGRTSLLSVINSWQNYEMILTKVIFFLISMD